MSLQKHISVKNAQKVTTFAEGEHFYIKGVAKFDAGEIPAYVFLQDKDETWLSQNQIPETVEIMYEKYNVISGIGITIHDGRICSNQEVK